MPHKPARFRQALALHQSGRLGEAEKLYRKVLKRDPQHADALHLLGLIAAESGQDALAEALIARAIAFSGPSALYCANLGQVLARQGKYKEAEVCYRQALRAAPRNAAVWVSLAQAQSSYGNTQEAERSLRAAITIEPNRAEAHYELGNLLYARQDFSQAGEAYQKALDLRPWHPETLYNLGVIRMVQTRVPEAESYFEAALRLKPGYAEAHNNLGILKHCTGDPNQALQHYRAALAANPAFIAARYNLAFLRQKLGHLEEACALYNEILLADPCHVDALNNLGNTLLSLSQPEEAASKFERVLEMRPVHAEAAFNRGIARLTLGDYRAGWAGFEWRTKVNPALERVYPCLRWAGEALGQKRILLWAEQGLGDTIQFVRFAKLVHQLGACIFLECRPPLAELLGRMPEIEYVTAPGSPAQGYDFHAPLMSLPHLLGTSSDLLAETVPYLTPDPERVLRWRRYFEDGAGKACLRVGLCWAGNPAHLNNSNRSLHAAILNPLAVFDGRVVFINLQIEGRSRPEIPFLPGLEAFDNFDVTAAAVANLDLVISVDTAVAHLAGALGRRVWTLLPYAADWRWLTQTCQSPWYPTMRLFRQNAPGDWPGVIQAVVQELETLLQ